jgi:hypothetical protein
LSGNVTEKLRNPELSGDPSIGVRVTPLTKVIRTVPGQLVLPPNLSVPALVVAPFDERL